METINNLAEAKGILKTAISSIPVNESIDDFLNKKLENWEDEKKSIERELDRKGMVNNYKLNKAIDLHFLIQATKDYLKM